MFFIISLFLRILLSPIFCKSVAIWPGLASVVAKIGIENVEIGWCLEMAWA